MFNVSVRKIVVSSIVIAAPVVMSFGASTEAWGGGTTGWSKHTSTHAGTTGWSKHTTAHAGGTTGWSKVHHTTTLAGGTTGWSKAVTTGWS